MTKLYQPHTAARASLWLRACASMLALAAVANGQVSQGSPVLLTEGTGTTTRAVAYDAVTFRSEPFNVLSPYNWNADKTNVRDQQTRVMLFAMNLSLLPGEGASALTADAQDATGRLYPLKVEALSNPKYLRLQPAPDNPSVQVPTEVAQPWLFAITLRLDDLMTENLGDVLVSLSLHGLRSNRVRIRIGQGTASPAVDSSVEFASPAPAIEPGPLPPLALKAYGPGESSDADTVRLLEQATWGPTTSEVARVQQMGLRAFVEEQLNMPPLFPEQGSDYPAMPIPHDGLSPDCPVGTPNQSACARENYVLYPVQVRFFTNAFYGGDQLHQRVAFALHQTVSCTNARGNMKAVVRAILLDPEARGDLKTDPRYGRLREPVQYMNNILRACNVRSFDRASESDGVLGTYIVSPDFPAMMDQAVYRPVSVFGYFTPDYVIPGANVGDPPFAILTTSTTLVRANFVNTLVHNGVNPNSTPASSPSRPRGTSIDLSTLVALAPDPPQLVSALDRLMLHGTMSQTMRASLLRAIESIPASEPGKRAQMALYVVATSPQYEVQR